MHQSGHTAVDEALPPQGDLPPVEFDLGGDLLVRPALRRQKLSSVNSSALH